MPDRVLRSFRRFWRDSRAVSTVEYALIVVAVIAVVGVAAGMLNTAFTDLFQDLTDKMGGAVDATDAAIGDDGAEAPATDPDTT